ncbi:MAG: PH domain-containing protein [Candidatus Harrisonbacteria bacterium]|nr:PH domain-containing protein [Candidatus Harrisonbacteria bacterium]
MSKIISATLTIFGAFVLFINPVLAQCTINGQPVPCDVLNAGLLSGLKTALFGLLATIVIAVIWGVFVAKAKHSREIHKVLDTDEKVLWEERPVFLPFFVSSLVGSLFGWVFVGFLWPSSSIFILFPLAFAVGIPIYTLLVYRFTYYAITHKRVIMQSGVIGRDFKIVDFDTITNSEVHVGLWDKLFTKDAGTVVIATAGAPISYSQGRRGAGSVKWPYALIHVPDAYGVFKIIKEVGHAVKTDIQYPNQYRPQANPGYKTEYNNRGDNHSPPQ